MNARRATQLLLAAAQHGEEKAMEVWHHLDLHLRADVMALILRLDDVQRHALLDEARVAERIDREARRHEAELAERIERERRHGVPAPPPRPDPDAERHRAEALEEIYGTPRRSTAA